MATFCDFIKTTAETLDFRPSARGWALCEAAIFKYMGDPALPERFEQELEPERETLRKIWRKAA